MLCAPILTPEGALGVLKISARRHGVLGGHEAGLVEDFLPLASLAVQFSVRTESLHKRVLLSERKHALANLTRGIASLNSSEIPRQHLMAGAVIATVPIMALFLGLERFMTKGLTAGSVKG